MYAVFAAIIAAVAGVTLHMLSGPNLSRIQKLQEIRQQNLSERDAAIVDQAISRHITFLQPASKALLWTQRILLVLLFIGILLAIFVALGLANVPFFRDYERPMLIIGAIALLLYTVDLWIMYLIRPNDMIYIRETKG